MVVGQLLVQASMSEAIKNAKIRLEKKHIKEDIDLKWLETTPLYPCEDDVFMVRLFLLEGKPPKGYILADYSSGIVRGFGENLKSLFTLNA
ncbi:MAG: hypothetical protein KAT05_12810 [Spirochaetes bacterium]|nr:hypothetical protein [Spirochaetota bacterium]